MTNEIPRRIRIDQFTPAERAIYDAMAAVEAAGASLALTDAVVLLQAARERVADHVDGIPGKRMLPRETESIAVDLIVNGNDRRAMAVPGERIGAVALRALLDDGYDWTTVELRDAEGRLINPGLPVERVSGTVRVTKPVGWGG